MSALELSKKYKSLLDKNGISTPLRLAHFFAQIDHESGGFKHLREIGNDAYFVKYEGRASLGNTQKGDGLKYKGRGFIQITGRANYTELTKATGIDYVNNPQWLEREPDAMISALWFWNRNKLNKYADLDRIDSISDLINKGKITPAYGDSNGFMDRANKLKFYKTVFKV
ncbi:glycoside hydrolase family 19 protein [Chryseobacterium mucoviscidosis]|uniref:glycoside hydrolase family 19 protein n=1 Tax=Chryseobacterium mucoviscidosis TaxID=1945581 RepID=UPI00301A7766